MFILNHNKLYSIRLIYVYLRKILIEILILFFFYFYSEKGDVTPHRMDEKFLLRFLRARHFKLNATYKLVSYFKKLNK